MDKIICDLCGTSYPDTASQCPICGTARTDASKQQSADMTADSYAYVRGGRFSKANVRKRNNGQGQVRQQPAQPTEKRRQPEEDPQPGSSNLGLIIVVVILLLAIIGVCAFIAIKFLDLKDSGIYNSNSTGSTQSSSSSALQVPCTGVSIDQKELSFTATNKTILLQPRLEPANTTDKVIYRSSDVNVVKVDADGLVTPVADGEATITITCGEFTAECKVLCTMGVEPLPPDPTDPVPSDPTGPADPTDPAPTDPVDPTPVTSFSLNRADFTLNGYGSSWDLTRNSEDAFGNNYVGPEDVSLITWSVDDPSVATVENGVVTAVGNGKATVTAEYNGKTRRCIVRCKNVVVPEGEPAEILYELNYTDVTMNPGEKLPLRLTNKENGLTAHGVTYTVEDETVCKVDADGNIEALAADSGSFTTITVEHEGQTYTCVVRIR